MVANCTARATATSLNQRDVIPPDVGLKTFTGLDSLVIREVACADFALTFLHILNQPLLADDKVGQQDFGVVAGALPDVGGAEAFAQMLPVVGFEDATGRVPVGHPDCHETGNGLGGEEFSRRAVDPRSTVTAHLDRRLPVSVEQVADARDGHIEAEQVPVGQQPHLGAELLRDKDASTGVNALPVDGGGARRRAVLAPRPLGAEAVDVHGVPFRSGWRRCPPGNCRPRCRAG